MDPTKVSWPVLGSRDKKEEIWLSPMTKAPTPTEMSKGQSENTHNATKSSIKQQKCNAKMQCKNAMQSNATMAKQSFFQKDNFLS